MKRLWTILLLSVSSLVLQGQNPFFTSPSNFSSFKQTNFNIILESQDGFHWFGTSDGLLKYDGFSFETVSASDSNFTNNITALFQDDKERIWVGNSEGGIYHLMNGQLQKWETEEAQPSVKITGFSQTADGIIWISTYGEGIYYYTNNRLSQINEVDGLSSVEIYAIERHLDNHVLLATDSGILVCKIKNDKKEIVHLTKQDGLSDELVQTILPTKDGNFWIGTFDEGLDWWNNKIQKFESLTPNWEYGPVNALTFFEEKEIWIGTEKAGLFRYDLETHNLHTVAPSQFSNVKINDLHKDKEGNVWVVNNKTKISKANRQFEQVAHSGGSVQALIVDSKGQKWAGTPEGFFQLNETRSKDLDFHKTPLGKEVNVVSLYEDPNEKIWIGTFGQGLYCYDPKEKKVIEFNADNGLLNDNILSIDGTDRKIWFATLGGVFEVELESVAELEDLNFLNYTDEDGLGTDFIYKVFVDSKNRTWFGTDGKGICLLEEGTIKNFSKWKDTKLKAVYNITEDLQGHIWFNTAENGIFEIISNDFIQLKSNEKLNDVEISSLVADQKGNLLIGHDMGIAILNPKTKQVTFYEDEVGLQNLEPVLNAVAKDKNGVVWIGAKDKLVRYTAMNESLELQPRTILKKVNIFFESIDFKERNTFSHDQNNLVFDYVGLWYTSPEKVSYRYKLEGYDPKWIYSKDLKAHYSNLRPGSYTFKVASTVNAGFNEESYTKYAFEIRAPFWEKSWFIVFVLISTFLLIYFISKWNSRRMQRETELQKERVESQLEVLKSQINPHFLFNSFNTLITLIEEEPELATQYVEKLSDFYRSLLQYREKDLIPLAEEFELLQNFSFLLKKRFGENIQIDIPMQIDQKAFIPPLTLQMLIENAVKHNVISQRKPLKINLELKKNQVVVTNNLQAKMTKEKSTEFGLQSIAARFDLLGIKNFKVEQTETLFRVTIPIINNI